MKYNCLVSNGIKKGHLLVSCSHQSGKAPLASAKGSCCLMQGIKNPPVSVMFDLGGPNKFVTKYINSKHTQVQSFYLCLKIPFFSVTEIFPPF